MRAASPMGCHFSAGRGQLEFERPDRPNLGFLNLTTKTRGSVSYRHTVGDGLGKCDINISYVWQHIFSNCYVSMSFCVCAMRKSLGCRLLQSSELRKTPSHNSSDQSRLINSEFGMYSAPASFEFMLLTPIPKFRPIMKIMF